MVTVRYPRRFNSSGCWLGRGRRGVEGDFIAMCLCSIDAVKQVAIKIIVEFAIERFAKVLSPRPQNLIVSNRRPLRRLVLDHRLLLTILRGRCEVSMSVKIALFKLDGLDGHGLDLFEVAFVV